MAAQPGIITLREWYEQHGVKPSTARKWVTQGILEGAYKSAETWLLPSQTAVPGTRSPGRPPKTT